MTPMRVTSTAGGSDYGNPFVGPVNHTAPVLVDLSGLTADEVDADGYLRPGVPLTRGGILVGAAPAFVYAVVLEPVRVTEPGEALATAADVRIAAGTIGQVNRDIIEDNLGRALTADEIAGFDRAGSKLVLI